MPIDVKAKQRVIGDGDYQPPVQPLKFQDVKPSFDQHLAKHGPSAKHAAAIKAYEKVVADVPAYGSDELMKKFRQRKTEAAAAMHAQRQDDERAFYAGEIEAGAAHAVAQAKSLAALESGVWKDAVNTKL